MFLLLSLSSIFCCYASEKEITNSVPLLEATQKYYYNYKKEYCSDSKVHFYNPVNNKITSFNPNDSLENLFSAIDQQSLVNITKIPEVKNFFEKTQLDCIISNQLTKLFKSIENIDLCNKKIKLEILYYLKLLFYNIKENEKKDLQVKVVYCQDFLKLVEKYISNTYNTDIDSFKKILFCMNGFLTLMLGSMGTVISLFENDPFILAPTLSPLAFIYLPSFVMYFQQLSAYKKYCNIIQNIKKLEDNYTHDIYLDIDISE